MCNKSPSIFVNCLDENFSENFNSHRNVIWLELFCPEQPYTFLTYLTKRTYTNTVAGWKIILEQTSYFYHVEIKRTHGRRDMRKFISPPSSNSLSGIHTLINFTLPGARICVLCTVAIEPLYEKKKIRLSNNFISI